jgi:PAS domain-containing protein
MAQEPSVSTMTDLVPSAPEPERTVPSLLEEDERLRAGLAYAEEIIATLREPFVVLDGSFRIKSANAAFYKTFLMVKEETEGRSFLNLGDGEWDVVGFRELLESVASEASIHDFEVEHDLPAIGPRSLLLNARRFPPDAKDPLMILLAIEDVTDRRMAELAQRASELRYRRLFQTAKDGILILEAETGTIIDANPFMSGLLGYELDEFLGKELWQIGLFGDKSENLVAYS